MDKIVTIDGPSGVGKGTASRGVARALGWKWLDSGALYRVTAYAAQHAKVAFDDIAGLVEVASQLPVDFVLDSSDEPPIVFQGKAINALIRTEQMGNNASLISKYPEVRAALLARQQAFLTDQGLVADGRDMGTVVFPAAPVKFFLTASAAVRAERRHKQLLAKGVDVNMRALLAEIEARDAQDRNRAVSPLIPAEDAEVLDTSVLSIAQVQSHILQRIGDTLGV